MAQPSKEPVTDKANREREEYGEEYELMPHKEILELREELHKLKVRPNEKTLQLSMVELSAKVDKLIDIFGEAMHEIRIEEGGLTFQDKMKPLVDRMDKILEQNSQIAEGVVAIADLVNELKDVVETNKGGSSMGHMNSMNSMDHNPPGPSSFPQSFGAPPQPSPQPSNPNPSVPPRMPPPPTRR